MSDIKVIKDDDGRNDMIFGFDVDGKEVQACTVHQEFLDIAGIPVEDRANVMQAVGQMFLGMLKPFMKNVEQD